MQEKDSYRRLHLIRPLPRSKQPFPSAIREKTEVPIYTSTKEQLPPNIGYPLSRGVQPFGPPSYVDEILDDIRRKKIDLKALGEYEGANTTPAEDFIRNWYGLNRKSARVALGNQGSYGLIMDVLFKLVKAPTQGPVRILDVGMDFPAAYKASQRYDTDAPPGNESPELPQKMPFYSVATDIDYTFDQAIEAACKNVDYFKRRGFKGFVVILSEPNSPKGAKSQNKNGIRELANLTNRAGYPLIIDEAFKPVLSPADSWAAELTLKYNNILVIGSASKIIGLPGSGISWLLHSEELPFEGTQTEYEMRWAGYLANAIFNRIHKNDLLNHVEDVTKRIEEIKEPFVQGLKSAGLQVFETDSKIPIFFVDGLHDGFCTALEEGSGIEARDGVRVARGSAFSPTYRPKPSPRYEIPNRATNFDVVTDRFARVTIPKTKKDVEKLIPLFTKAAAA